MITQERSQIKRTKAAVTSPLVATEIVPATGNGFSRFARASLTEQPVEYEFTHDPALLHQYFMLREQMFISVWGLKAFDGTEDHYDPLSDILIAKVGNLCVGGSRLTFSTPENRILLPMEQQGLSLTELFPELHLENKSYSECTRLALLPDYRTREVSFDIRYYMVKHCLQKNADYGFFLSPLVQARNYRQTFLSLGLQCRICTEIEIPDKEEYEGIKMYMTMLDFTPSKKDPRYRLERSLQDA